MEKYVSKFEEKKELKESTIDDFKKIIMPLMARQIFVHHDNADIKSGK